MMSRPEAGPNVRAAETIAPSRLRRMLVPPIRSERHAIVALVTGFLLEAVTEVYQFVTAVRSANTSPGAYYLSLALTLVGFYFLWRGLHEWNRLAPRRARTTDSRGIPWMAIILLTGGVAATALVNIALGTVGDGDTPPPLAWAVGGVMVLAFGAFFLNLRRMVAPTQTPIGQTLGWVAVGWSLVISTFAGLALGQVIVGLFVDFFTNWTALILALAPFIFVTSPLFVTFGLLSVAYADAYRRAAATGRTGPPGGP